MTRFRPWHLLLLLIVAFVVATRLADAGAWVSAAPAAPQNDSQCFYPSADAYVYNQEPGTNFGSASDLALSSFGDVIVQTRHSFLRFNLDAIPEGATVLSADLELYLDSAGGSFTSSLQAVDDNWGENTITWNNRPGRSGNYDSPTHSSSSGWKVWQADALVNEWVNNVRANRGLALITNGVGTPLATFFSSEGSATRSPRLCVEWTEDPLNVDLVVDDIEVTQAVQDLNNSVRLVAGKRTFVRVHVHSSSQAFRSFATLRVTRGASSTTLDPINPGGFMDVKQTPDRALSDDAFLFEVPSSYTGEGSLVLRADVNPVLSWRPNRYPEETDYGNNSMTTSVNFESVPKVGLIMYRATYTTTSGSTVITHTTPITDVYQARDWLRRAFPISEIWMTTRRHHLGEVSVDAKNRFTSPDSDDVNAELTLKRIYDLTVGSWYEDYVGNDDDIRYYSLVVDSGGFMRGSSPSPGHVASGPTGPAASWDPDGIYGDWYTGHELGHSFDRAHVEGDPGGKPGACGGEAGVDNNYPYADGFISDDASGEDAFYGFDIGSEYQSYGLVPQAIRVYDTTWRDMMTYCDPLWISDYTYEGIMDYVQDNVTPLAAEQVTDRLLVVGSVDPASGEATLQPLMVLPEVPEVDPRVPGEYSIVLRDGGGSVLANYSFTPVEMGSGPPNPDGEAGPALQRLLISEAVPYVAGTDRVDVVGPQGVMETVVAGPATPAVTLLAPNGGETLSGDTLPVSWSASDGDGDDLSFNVAFSADDGATWELLAQGLSGDSVQIPRENVPTTSQGRFRVYASDGIHTTSDDSDGTFATTSRLPEVTIQSPESGTTFAANQTINFQALAFSPNIGTIPEENIAWVSNIDGNIGNGEQLSVTGLTPGVHNVGVFVSDGVGANADTIQDVVIVENPSLLPTLPDGLVAGPDPLLFWPGVGLNSRQLSIENQSGTDSIPWAAFPVDSWVEVSAGSGSTPAEITVSVDASGLGPGVHESGVVLGSTEVPGEIIRVEIAVHVYEEGNSIYLPVTLRE